MNTIISRAEARAKGLKHYFTGKPCPKGHVVERVVGNANCVECNRLRFRYENITPEQIERARAKDRAWRNENRERNRGYKRKENMTPDAYTRYCERVKRNNHYRNALKLGSGGRLSPNIRDTLFTAQRGQCVYCCVALDQSAHLDHILPLTLGGPNTDDNAQLLCPTCNCSKCNTHPDVYEARIGYVRKRKRRAARSSRRLQDAA